jgi:hypothetical protein
VYWYGIHLNVKPKGNCVKSITLIPLSITIPTLSGPIHALAQNVQPRHVDGQMVRVKNISIHSLSVCKFRADDTIQAFEDDKKRRYFIGHSVDLPGCEKSHYK